MAKNSQAQPTTNATAIAMAMNTPASGGMLLRSSSLRNKLLFLLDSGPWRKRFWPVEMGMVTYGCGGGGGSSSGSSSGGGFVWRESFVIVVVLSSFDDEVESCEL